MKNIFTIIALALISCTSSSSSVPVSTGTNLTAGGGGTGGGAVSTCSQNDVIDSGTGGSHVDGGVKLDAGK